MSSSDAKTILNGAAGRYDRRLRALDDDYARVDGRSFSELLDFAVKLAKLIRFYNLDDKIAGDWADFFDTDPTFDEGSLNATAAREKPQLALYVAFVRLFRTAQDTINTLSRRYARFYYRDVLREQGRAAVPDHVDLTFTPAESEEVLRTLVPRGTLFPAGRDDDDRDVVYASDRDLVVGAARIARLRTLRAVRGKLDPKNDDSPRVVRRILSSEIAVAEQEAEASGAVAAAGEAAWPTFGETSVGATAAEVTEPATLGFAVASPFLWLTGGTRKVALSVRFTAEFAGELDHLLGKLHQATGLTKDEIFRDVLGEAFTLYLSTAAGWFRVERYEVDPPAAAGGAPELVDRFRLRFELPPWAPPVEPYDPESEEAAEEAIESDLLTGDPTVLATNPAPHLPTLKAYLKQDPVVLKTVRVHPVSLLGGSEFRTGDFEIRTDVAELGNLQLENTDGEIDTSSPFPVFGALPVVGSYLLIRQRELFVKMLHHLDVTVRWFDLPQNDDGFKGYYKDYVLGLDDEKHESIFDNQSFHGGFRVCDPGPWFLEKKTATRCPKTPPAAVDVYLFRTVDEDKGTCSGPTPAGKLCTETDFDELRICPHPLPDYYDPATSAVKLELTQPKYGFGDDLYAKNVLNAVIEDLPDFEGGWLQCLEECLEKCRGKDGEIDPECFKECMVECTGLKKELKYPNEPYHPQAESLTVGYTADCTLPGTEEEEKQDRTLFFHLLPFDGYDRRRPAAKEPTRLLPRFSPGNLYLGFSGLRPPQSLTLLFQMVAGSTANPSGTLPPVVWDYLSGNRWQHPQSVKVGFDSTHGLESSGIVALGLPAFDSADNTVLSADYQWIRASVAAKPGRFPDTIGIYPHAVSATWQDHDQSGEQLEKPLPAHTINGAVDELPEIEAVDQPMASFGGRPAETRRSFEIRLGERLRHKDRAILGWDYERLVLERFPTIWKVQALAAHDPERGDVPGHVLVVVVPGPDALGTLDPTAPTAPGELLERIRAYLGSRVSPFVKFHVVNPIYVRIEVRTKVAFKNQEDPDECIERLNDELVHYLSPWFYNAARARKGGHYASEADVSELIQTRSYVEVMEELDLEYQPCPKHLGSDWYFLTSAKKHQIRLIRGIPGETRQTNQGGI